MESLVEMLAMAVWNSPSHFEYMKTLMRTLLSKLFVFLAWLRRRKEFLAKLPIGIFACSASVDYVGYVQFPMLLLIRTINYILSCP